MEHFGWKSDQEDRRVLLGRLSRSSELTHPAKEKLPLSPYFLHFADDLRNRLSLLPCRNRRSKHRPARPYVESDQDTGTVLIWTNINYAGGE